MKRLFGILILLGSAAHSVAQIVSFSFSPSQETITGFTSVYGDPHVSVRTGTANGITITTVSTSNWSPSSSDGCAASGIGAYPTYYMPGMANCYLQYNGTAYNLALYNALVPQLELTGLNPDSSYILRMSASDVALGGSTTYTVAGASVAGSQTLTTWHNQTQGITFQNVYPDGTGMIKVYVNGSSTSDYAFISGIEVFSGSANVGTPVVALTTPVNGTIFPEGGNLAIAATATETGNTIAKVEFYADTTKIGEADAAPYTMTWTDPTPGNYQIVAKATDNVGTINTAQANIAVESLNYFWSTTGNAATNGDTNFVGTVDSNRLSFRTRNLERMAISANGKIRLEGLANDSTESQPRMLVSDTSGNLSYRSIASSGLSGGQGLGGTSSGIALGDSISGPGPHSFTSNRYQYLNGYQYSIGGSVNDPVNHPVFRMYNNGDLSAGTTTDTTVNTVDQTGLRYYAKSGYLEIGASDRVDTALSAIAYGTWPTSGIIINTDVANTIRGKIMNTVFASDNSVIDSGIWMENNFIAGEHNHFSGGTNTYIRSFIGGYGHAFSASMNADMIDGQNLTISKPTSMDIVSGFENVTQDTSWSSLINGEGNQFGGLSQLVSGQGLVNRTPMGTVLGNYNVDFSTLSYTGLKGANASGLSGYPLFVLGNANAGTGTIHSNAVTVLYNGRTQINTNGFSNTLTQTNVTPQAALDVVSTNTGVLLPRLNTTQRNAIVSGDLQNGLLLYNIDSTAFQYYNGGSWNTLGTGGGGGSHWITSTGAVYDSLDNVAIGTSNAQGYKLAVNGSAVFTKIVVKPRSAWPDYVFKKRYVLPGLDELGRYIREHHHLPGVASEEQIALRGIDLGEQQTALLRKIEELTLYLVKENEKLKDQSKQITEQNKQLSDQGARLDAQQKEIDELKAEMLHKRSN
jgi:Bacterial Ig domain